MQKNYAIFGLVFTSLLLVGGGSSSSDTSLVIDFFNEWARSRNIVDANGKPTANTIWYVATGQSTGDDQADAAIDAGQVIKSIKDADDKVAKADVALAKNPPDRTTALADITAAANDRPKDQAIRSRKGVILLEVGQSQNAQQYLATNSSRCSGDESKMTQAQRERCFDQIQSEANFMADANSRAYKNDGKPRCDVVIAQQAAKSRLYYLAKYMNFDDNSMYSLQMDADPIRAYPIDCVK